MCFERSEVTTRRLSQVMRIAQLRAFEHSQLHIALFPEATFDLRELAGFAVRAYHASQGGRRVRMNERSWIACAGICLTP